MAIQKTDHIWHNGNLIPWDSATIHVMSHVVHYGSSVFEGVRCYALPSGPAIFRAQEHMQRLLDSARIYRIEVDFTREELLSGMVDLVKARMQAVKLLMDDRLTDDRFYWARHAHLVSYAEYAMRQPLLAASMPGGIRNMYEPVTAEAARNDCCGHLLTTIGLQHMYPERAAHLHATAGSPDVRSISPTARQAIMQRLR